MKRKRINLALQGGGAHGAFTWGVLDRLLEEDDIEIAGNDILAHGISPDRQTALQKRGGLTSAANIVRFPDWLKRIIVR
jgi:hypothetical protein